SSSQLPVAQHVEFCRSRPANSCKILRNPAKVRCLPRTPTPSMHRTPTPRCPLTATTTRISRVCPRLRALPPDSRHRLPHACLVLPAHRPLPLGILLKSLKVPLNC